MSQTIHFFVRDTVFVNRFIPVAPLLQADGVCVLSEQLLANYVIPYEIKDPRSTRLSLTALPFNTTMSLITDAASSVSDVISSYMTLWSSSDKTSLFNIVDQVSLGYNTSGTVQSTNDTHMSANPGLFPTYKAGSLVYSTTHTTPNVYFNSSPDTITIPDTAQFTLHMTDLITNQIVEYNVILWFNGVLFEQKYSISTITAIIPPLTFTDLLNKPLTGLTDNALVIGKESSQVSILDLATPVNGATLSPITEGVSGYVSYNAKFLDANGNYLFMPFNVLYKGHLPGTLAIRETIKAILLGSGVGTSAQWQARIPELFINAAYYLIPIWNNTTTTSTSTVYPDITSINTAIVQTKTVLYDVPADFVMNNMMFTTAVYDEINLTAVPDQANATNRQSLLAEYPTYQSIPTTDSNFTYMDTLAKQYAINLNNALAVAAGAVSSNAFNIVSLNQPTDTIQRRFVTFTIGDVEIFVITKESFLNILASPPSN